MIAVCKKVEMKCNNIIKIGKIINIDDSKKNKNIIQIGYKFLIIHRILIIGGFRSGKSKCIIQSNSLRTRY